MAELAQLRQHSISGSAAGTSRSLPSRIEGGTAAREEGVERVDAEQSEHALPISGEGPMCRREKGIGALEIGQARSSLQTCQWRA